VPVHDAVFLAVEAPARGVRVVRVAGDLDASGAPRLATLGEVLMRRLEEESAGLGPAHLVLDLSCVRTFEAGGLPVLSGLREDGLDHGVAVHLAGLSGHQALLPGQVADLLSRASTFPTVECALRALQMA